MSAEPTAIVADLAAARHHRDQSADAAEPCAAVRASLDQTDAGNARRLALLAKGELLAVTGAGYVCWDGSRYAPDDVEHTTAMRWALRSADAIKDECDVLRADGADDKTVTSRYQHYLRSQSAPRLDAALRIARVGMQVAADDLDTDPDVLNAPNGTIDLKTGKLRPHDRGDLISKRARAPYQPDARCPVWASTLATVLPDEELRSYFQRAVGYAATGYTSEQVFMVWLGAGANGKTVADRAISYALGDYATKAAAETFMISRRAGGDTRSDLVALRGARLISTSETTDGLRFDERLLKEFTGGEPITARSLYSSEVTFTPRGTLTICCNALPRFDGADYAMRRRLRVIPFGVQIPAADQDRHLSAKLAAEAPGILRWIVDGARDWYAQGLGGCAAVEAASNASAQDMDPVGQYLDDTCVLDPHAFTASSVIAASYGRWASENRQPDIGARKLADGLTRHGVTADRERLDGKRVRGWRGVRLTTDPPAGTRRDTFSRDFQESPPMGNSRDDLSQRVPRHPNRR